MSSSSQHRQERRVKLFKVPLLGTAAEIIRPRDHIVIRHVSVGHMAEAAMQSAMDRVSAAAYRACAAALADSRTVAISVHQPKHMKLQNGAAVTQLYAHLSG